MIKGSLMMIALFLYVPVASTQVLMEVPLLLELPRKQHLINAWYDGETFFIDGKGLFERLNFKVETHESTLKALDIHRQYGFNCVGSLNTPTCQIPLNDVLEQLGDALHFDETRLHLTASSAASTFKIQSTHVKHWAQGPHLFPQTRQLWGGLMMGWQLRHDEFGVRPSIEMTTSALYGTIKAHIGNRYSWKYTYDWPHQKWLTQVGVGTFTDGMPHISVTNRPLIQPHLQHVKVIRGQSTPHALIQAIIGGEIVDQIQADASGKYNLHTPIWYGSTKMQIRSQPLGGSDATSEYSYLLTPASLLPAKKMFYHMAVSPSSHTLELQYGIHQRLTLETSLELNQHHRQASIGATVSPARNMALNTIAFFPEHSWEANLQLWRARMQVTASFSTQNNELWNASLTGSVSRGAVTMFMRAHHFRFRDDHQHVSVNPEIFVHHSSGLLFQTSYEISHTQSTSIENAVDLNWYTGTGWSVARTQILAFADHRRSRKIYGLKGTLLLRHQSVGFSIGWDANHQAMSGGLSIQASSAFGSLFAQSRAEGNVISHAQYLQGSLHLGSGVSLSPSANQASAAELRIFEDLNGNSIQDLTEPVLSHIEAQLYEGSWVRLRTGSLYVAHLEPYKNYQVRLLEASIQDPFLYPATGLEFSFTADPGQRKIIRVPMQRLTTVTGQVTGLDRAPLRLIARLNGHGNTEVYRDGGFSVQLRPGTYTVSIIDVLTEKVLAEKRMEVDHLPLKLSIDLNRDAR